MSYGDQRPEDPLAGFMFSLELGGQAAGFFAQVSGIGSESEVITRKVIGHGGGDMRKIPGRLTYTDVTLRRGITQRVDIWEWRQLVVDGKMNDARQNCSIVLYDSAGNESARWNFVNAWPSKITGPMIQAGTSDYAIEQLTIVHESMKRDTAGG